MTQRQLLDVMLEELRLDGARATSKPVDLSAAAGASLYVNTAGWPSLTDSEEGRPSDGSLREAVSRLASTVAAASTSEAVEDVLLDAACLLTLEQRSQLVRNLVDALDGGDPAGFRPAEVIAILAFVDDSLSIDGPAAMLSIEIHTAVMRLRGLNPEALGC